MHVRCRTATGASFSVLAHVEDDAVELSHLRRRLTAFRGQQIIGGHFGYAPKNYAGAARSRSPLNMKAAKALDLDVPLHLQQLADEVIDAICCSA